MTKGSGIKIAAAMVALIGAVVGWAGGSAEAALTPGQAVPIEFWHAMGGAGADTTTKLVNRFNSSQDRVEVTAVFQGSYDETYTKLLTSFDTGTIPDIVQMYETATQTMIDTRRIVPVHQLMKKDKYDPSSFVPAVREYYSDGNGMVAMPFNSSTPLLYYNIDAFEAAGVKPPIGTGWSFSELIAACKKLQASGVVKHGIAVRQHNWYFEELLGSSGGLYFDNNNGRTGRATRVVYNESLGVEVLGFLAGLVKNGYSADLGSGGVEPRGAFLAGQAAMVFDSSGVGGSYQGSAKFKVGTMFIPYADSSTQGFHGPVIGGAALWVLDTKDDKRALGAWEFAKFLAAEPQQVTWHKGTGFFPVRQAMEGLPELIEFWKESPFFRTGVEQLAATRTRLPDGSVNYAVLGGRAGPYPSLRNHVTHAFSWVLRDGLTLKAALDRAAEAANRELSEYNEFFK